MTLTAYQNVIHWNAQKRFHFRLLHGRTRAHTRSLISYRSHFYVSCRCLTGHFISVKLYLCSNATVPTCTSTRVLCTFFIFERGVSKLVFPSLPSRMMRNTKAKGIIKQKTHIYEILNRHHICDTKCPKAESSSPSPSLQPPSPSPPPSHHQPHQSNAFACMKTLTQRRRRRSYWIWGTFAWLSYYFLWVPLSKYIKHTSLKHSFRFDRIKFRVYLLFDHYSGRPVGRSISRCKA